MNAGLDDGLPPAEVVTISGGGRPSLRPVFKRVTAKNGSSCTWLWEEAQVP